MVSDDRSEVEAPLSLAGEPWEGWDSKSID
jgi:hypothetical protein